MDELINYLIAEKAGNSEGVRKSWATRLGRLGGSFARQTLPGRAIAAGMRYRKSIPGRIGAFAMRTGAKLAFAGTKKVLSPVTKLLKPTQFGREVGSEIKAGGRALGRKIGNSRFGMRARSVFGKARESAQGFGSGFRTREFVVSNKEIKSFIEYLQS